jgi:6-phosphogluconolactonase
MLVPFSRRRVATRGLLALSLVAAALCVAPALASADNDGGPLTAGAVYTQTNNPAGNTVIFFQRNHDGTLTQRGEVPTGGTGAANQPPFGFPVVDSSESVRLSPGGHLLFVVNGGDNSISSFVTTPWGPVLRSHVSSGGSLPISVDIHGDLVYVLNEGSNSVAANISGFRVSDDGKLTPIPNSTQPLDLGSESAPAHGAAAQIGFSPSGSVINVTVRLSNTIDTFYMHNGVPGPAIPTVTTPVSTGTGHLDGTPGPQNPFGFTYHHSDDLIVTDADAFGGFNGYASSYELNHKNSATPLTPISPAVANNALAPCWVVLTNNQKWAFVSNTVSGANQSPKDVSTFAVSEKGALRFVRNTPGSTPEGFTSDLDTSQDGRWLYVLQPSNVTDALGPNQAPAGSTSHIDEFKVNEDNGTITLIGSTPANLTNSLSGLAAK